jgi:hypothetical protein
LNERRLSVGAVTPFVPFVPLVGIAGSGAESIRNELRADSYGVGSAEVVEVADDTE